MMPSLLKLQFETYAQLNSHKVKVKSATDRVTQWLQLVHNPYIAFSGGKDSLCVLDLIRKQSSQIPAVYIDADCAFPEVKKLLNDTENCLFFPADEPFLSTLASIGLSTDEVESKTMQTTVYGPIKKLIEQYNFDGVAYGLRADECRGRALHAYRRGAVFQYKRDWVWGCQPIWDWNYHDVWAYIISNNLSYAETYDKLWDAPIEDQRVSYWAGETKRRYGRYAWLKRNYPDLFKKLCAVVPEVSFYV